MAKKVATIQEILDRGNINVLEDPDDITKFLIERNKKAPNRRRFRIDDDEGPVIAATSHKRAHAAVKLPTAQEVAKLVSDRGMPMREDYPERVLAFFTSDERVDEDGDIVRQVWDFSRYERLSRVLEQHDWGGNPVGRSILWEVRDLDDGTYKGPALFQLFLFAPKDVNPEADQVFRMYKARFRTETSVGFIPLKVIHVESEDDRTELGLGRFGVIFDKSKLIETSTCTVACNEGAQIAAALTKAQEAGLVNEGDLDMILRNVKESARESVTMDFNLAMKLAKEEKGNKDFSEEEIESTIEETSIEAQIAELRQEMAGAIEEITGMFRNLKDGLVALYPNGDATLESGDEETTGDELTDADLENAGDEDDASGDTVPDESEESGTEENSEDKPEDDSAGDGSDDPNLELYDDLLAVTPDAE